MTRNKDSGYAEHFRQVYDATYRDTLLFAMRRVPQSEAEDVVAEAFTVAWRRIDKCPTNMSDARAWLFGITRNCLLNARRSNRRAEALEVRLASTGQASDVSAIDVSAQIDFITAWRQLPAADQEVLALHVFDDLDAPQAAAILEITASAYRMR